MVVFYLKNSRAPENKIVPVTVALNKEVLYPYPDNFPDLQNQEGDGIWILTLSTTERDVDGDPIPPEIINVISETTLHLELEAGLGRIGQKVNWGPLSPDTTAPKVVEITPPLTQTTGVPIASNIIVRLKEGLPASGMDLSTLNLTLNGFPIISGGVVQSGYDAELRGNVFDLTIIHRPHRLLN